ncbi:YggS family pyridoxal phosphate-dependent enzyme [Microbacterium sp. YY-03]|uniref:YggS family pyridoxal phosphate-dependent enzyme n=1 Tax=Microbacterium sp. YY-03 TaxID=3421636 RepID=UPI003D17F7CB
MSELHTRLAEVDENIASAARRFHRDPAEITRIVVTKFHPAQLITDLSALGVRDVGENRQQELSQKREELAGLEGMRWHFIGQAQSNKARQIRAAADVVHSVDREKIATALEAAGEPGGSILDVLLQVNLTNDLGRGGAEPDDIEKLATVIAGMSTLRLRGVMAVAPLDEDPAPAFERLAGYSGLVRGVVAGATWISAGMSHDFAEAIAHGATHLRIGSAITGTRPARG